MQIIFPVESMLAKLESCRAEVSGPGKKKALRAGGDVLKAAMEQHAPVLDAKTAGSNALEPGSLKAGMRVLSVDEDGEPALLVGPGGQVEHVARWVEFGHRQVSGGYSKLLANGKTRGPGKASDNDVQAHPFLRPAFEESLDAIKLAESVSLAETIQKGVR